MSPPPPLDPGSRVEHDVRMRGFSQRMEVNACLQLIDQSVTPLSASEEIPFDRAVGRVLSADVRAEVSVPHFDRAAMDGYALRAEDTFGATSYNRLKCTVIGESLPGQPHEDVVGPGQAVRIMTGAPVPEGANAVLPAEMAQEERGDLVISDVVTPGRHVGTIGEDIQSGSVVLRAGRCLRPQDIGLLSSIGVNRVSVLRRPRVGVLVTGNELLPAGSTPSGYSIVDSNSPMLTALIHRDGGEPAAVTYLPDEREAIRQALITEEVDLLLVSGGTSVGKEDHVPQLVAELGELLVHGLALRPASPTGMGLIGSRPVFLLPGNPVSCLCAYDLFARRALCLLGGRSTRLPYPSVTLPLKEKMVSMVGRVDYVRVKIEDDRVTPLAISGASILRSTVVADGFVLVDQDREGYAPGETVTVYRYDL